MSIDINWEALTSGPDGAALADTIRDFVHDRFQSLPLPKLIRSINVHKFEFGQTAPEIVLKDICDPLPDFYESDEDEADSDADPTKDMSPRTEQAQPTTKTSRTNQSNSQASGRPLPFEAQGAFSSLPPPGLMRATSNLGYFQHLSAGLSGSQTPLAAVAGAHYQTGPPTASGTHHHHAESFSSISPPPSDTPTSLHEHSYHGPSSEAIADDLDGASEANRPQRPDSSPEDVQIVFHVTYSGDIRLSLTADVFLDYPMPSFVGIPLKLRITGITFNGVGIVAYIKKRAHLCFLSPDDAEALVGGETLESLDSPDEQRDGKSRASKKVGALLEDIKIESEMGETDTGKQVLKNVGKIEKFILEQVQRIFEDEFVYPSFWTFLV
jgi:distribution and morphology protein 12